ncbi:ABC transporter substrate-binding protein [Xenophilus azovorans]|uniref:ABC transporter substrate-binding protein n=1 Tax=Xenophilus azovorans TaxID=151755 RepID=UPI00056E0EC0|nr:ABC transporter substrate-binding protein [Xenophilus azovorans]
MKSIVIAASRVLAGASLATLAFAAHSQGVIRFGEVNSYKAQPAFLEPYRKGLELAVEQINASGGLLGKRVELAIRDDNGNPGDAVRAAEELITRERVDLLTGTFLSHIGLAVTDFAKQRRIFFLGGYPLTDKIVWQNGNRYTYRLGPSTYMQVAMLVPEALSLKKKRWAIVYPNYEYGQSAAATFKKLMKAAQPDIEFVAEQAPALGKIEAGAVVQALADAKPDAIFNVLFATDLAKFVREGTTRGLFGGREVVSLLTGQPEYLDPLRAESPVGWIVTGYPWYGIQGAEHQAFLSAYQKKFSDHPRYSSVQGYAAIMSLAAGIRKAGSTESEKLVEAFKGLEVDTPLGRIHYRAQDNQSTMGTFVGRIAVRDGKGVMVDYQYRDGGSFQPTDAEVRAMRSQD